MDDPVQHPQRDADPGDTRGEEPGRAPRTAASRWQAVVGILGLVVVLWVGTQMVGQLTGRGPGGMGHGPGQDGAPDAVQDNASDSQDDGTHGRPEGWRGH